MIVKALFIIWLLLLAVQDFKYRAISWYLFPIGLGVALLFAYKMDQQNQILSIALPNISFIIIQITVLTMYLSIKHKTFINIFKGYFGIGDTLFLLVIAFVFSPVNYILFFVITLLISLIVFIFLKLFKNVQQVPLAGTMALVLALINGLGYWISFSMYSDKCLLKLMY